MVVSTIVEDPATQTTQMSFTAPFTPMYSYSHATQIVTLAARPGSTVSLKDLQDVIRRILGWLAGPILSNYAVTFASTSSTEVEYKKVKNVPGESDKIEMTAKVGGVSFSAEWEKATNQVSSPSRALMVLTISEMQYYLHVWETFLGLVAGF